MWSSAKEKAWKELAIKSIVKFVGNKKYKSHLTEVINIENEIKFDNWNFMINFWNPNIKTSAITPKDHK